MSNEQKARHRELGLRISSYPALSERIESIPDLLASWAREVAVMELALAAIANDPYYLIIELSYFKGMTDSAIGARMHCDPSTVTRNRRRLVERMAAILYDTDPAA